MVPSAYTQLWAKTGAGGSWHTLLCHLLDVGAVASRLVERTSLHVLQKLAARVGVSPEAFRRWVVLLAALHDLGKASPQFQRQWAPGEQRLLALGFVFGPKRAYQPHGRVTAVELAEHLRAAGCSGPFARQAARWVGGHHGVFPTDTQILDTEGLTGNAAWRDARAWLLAQILEVMPQGEPPTTEETLGDVGLWLAGLTSVADWIGSMSEDFPFVSGPVDPATYFELSLARADRALERIGFRPWEPGACCSFDALFGFQPRPLQQTVIELTEGVAAPVLAIVEAPMGEGKTEAALWLGHELGRLAGHEGLYVALPTTATSNQMFRRVKAFLESSYTGRLSLQLLHGSAELVESFSRLTSVVDDDRSGRLDDCEAQGTVVAEQWFTKRKRGLLSTFAVGTIDQALLGVLRTKHSFVRIFGLAGKTVVLDEVHAYDAYTSRLLDRLVSWLRRLGASVVILSATLPSARRRELMAAWGTAPAEVVPYPRVSAVKAGEPWTRHIPASTTRTVALEWIEGDLPGALEHLARKLADGGCAGLICNTVLRAQTALTLALALRDSGQLPKDTEVVLIHARFTMRDRQARETRVLQALGKPSSGALRPRCALIIGTQVLEQSLDIDFDYLATDLAPVDLVLQRSGRLWRHERPRPAGCDSPTLSLLVPDEAASPKGPSLSPHSYLYAEAILLRSWLALRELKNVELPAGIEPLIETVYGDAPMPTSTGAMADRLTTAEAALKQDITDLERDAETRLLAPADSADDPFAHFALPLDEDDPTVAAALRAITRLGGPSAQVICLERRANGLYPIGGESPVDMDDTPSIAAAKQMVASGINVSSPGLVRALRPLATPDAWATSPFLRNALPLVLLDGTCTIERTTFRYDDVLGFSSIKSSNSNGGAV